MTDKELMEYIHEHYAGSIRSASTRNISESVIAGIIARESAGGLSLSPRGPGGVGDYGHGRGLCQIDDRSFPDFCASDLWREPDYNILFAVRLLDSEYAFFYRYLDSVPTATNTGGDDDLRIIRATLAAYNCGPALVRKCIHTGRDVDTFTTNHNYSTSVLAYARLYSQVLSEHSSTGNIDPSGFGTASI